MADLGLLAGAFAGQDLFAAAAMDAPAAAVGDLADLLDVHVGYVARIADDDPLRLAVALPARVDVSAAVEPQPVQPARDRAHAAVEAVTGGQFVGDAPSGPLMPTPPGLDHLDHP